MKIVAEAALYSPSPEFDFIAFDDAVFPDGPVGHGRTPLAALKELLEMVDGDTNTEAAVKAKIEELKS